MKTVLITGASRGIGGALAKRFLANGDRVIGTSRSGEVEMVHANFSCLPLELTDSKSIATCVQKIGEQTKSIDILVNNAGIWHSKDDTLEIHSLPLRETFDVNVFGTIEFTEKILPLMGQNGHILNVSSRRGSLEYIVKTDGSYPDYCLSKAALNMFTRLLSVRLKGRVTVSSVHPGFVQTDMNEGEGDFTPEEAAEDIFALTMKPIETGQFWFKGEKFPW